MQLAEGKLNEKTTTLPIALQKWWPYLLATLIAVIAKFPSLNNNIMFIDEPNYFIQAKRLDSLEAFIFAFQYRSEVKFQWSIVPQIIALAISHDNAILIMRIFGLFAVIIGFCLLLAISNQLFKNFLPGFIALVSWAFLLNYNYIATPPLLEYFQTPLLLLAFWLFIMALETEKKANWNLFWAGVSLAFAVMIKTSCLTVVPVFGFTLIFYRAKAGTPWFNLSKLKLICWFGLGIILPIALTILPYFFNSVALAELKFNMIDLTFNYGKLSDTPLVIKGLLLLFFFGGLNLLLIGLTTIPFLVSRMGFHRKQWSRLDTYQLLLLLVGWSLFIGFLPGLTKPIYLIPVLPFIMLFVGYRLTSYLSRLKTPRLRMATIALFFGLLLLANIQSLKVYYDQLFVDKGQIYYEDTIGLDVPAIVSYVKANTKPNELIWEYYNFPEIYWLANRKPATADPSSSYLYLFNDDFWYTRTRDQLNTELPALIIGVNTPHRASEGSPILTDLPKIKEFLAQKYSCNTAIIKNVILCKLNP